jgi:hypothetical protein
MPLIIELNASINMFYLLKHLLLLNLVIFKLKCNNLIFNEILSLYASYVCLLYSRFIENHPIWILEDGRLISEVVLSQVSFLNFCFHLFKFLKLIQSLKFHRKFRKIQNKFCINPLQWNYALGLTKYLFMHFCLVDKSKKLNLEEIIYKNPCMFIH